MVEHRRTPRNPVAVPAGWFIIASIVACVGAAGYLGVLLLGPGSASAEDASASTPAPTATTASPTATTASPDATDGTAAPDATATTATPEPPTVVREAPVAVLNNTGITNLAQSFSAEVAAAGWTVAGLGNWRGQIVSNTVYYPEDLQDQGRLLAADVGIDRVMPSIVPMRMDRLTIILSGPQQ